MTSYITAQATGKCWCGEASLSPWKSGPCRQHTIDELRRRIAEPRECKQNRERWAAMLAELGEEP